MAKSFGSQINDMRKKFDAQIARIEEMAGSYVLVGFQEGVVTKSADKQGRKKKAGLSMAQIAAQNEFGTKTIPARSFMRTSYDENKDKINTVITKQYESIVDGSSTTKRSLNLIGIYMTSLIQQKIRAITTPPNAPSTIAEKKSSKPLIDFGQMVQSVTHKVVTP